MFLNLDCIWYIMTFMPFDECVELISRHWLKGALKQWQHFQPSKWHRKLRLYSHHIVIGSKDDYWKFFCRQIINRKKRKRNDEYQLTWKAATQTFMIDGWGCRGCGHPTTSEVFGPRICINCRQNRFLKHTFMLKVYQALSWATRKQLEPIPYHGGPMNGHWRFWTDIVNAVPGLEDSREIRYQF
jgi:hypothetical protein